MARARNIKPGFFDNEILGELPALTRLLFIGLWCLADREGRLQDRPKRIKKELLGYDDVTADDVDTMLQQLNDNGFIQRYEISGEQYIQVTNFLKHQNPHCKEQASVIPAPGEDMGLGVVAITHVKGRTETAENSQDPRTYQTEKEQENIKTPDMHSASTVQAQEKHGSCPADSLIPDSLIQKPRVGNSPPSTESTNARDRAASGGGEPPAGSKALVDAARQANPALATVVRLRKRRGEWLRLTPTNPEIHAAIDEGVTVEAIEAFAEAYPDKPPLYVIRAARRDHAEKATPIQPGGTHHARGPHAVRGAVEETLAAIERRRSREDATAIEPHDG